MRDWLYQKMSDEALMRAYARGHAAAFDHLYGRYKHKLYTFLKRQCSDPAVAEELAHDAWLAVINRAASYTTTAKFSTWLYRIAHYRLVDYWRKYGSDANVLLEELTEQVLRSAKTERDQCTEGLELEDLLAVLAQLPAKQIEALLLKVEGFSRAEIAQITQAKGETVKSRLRYATNQLRAAMELRA